MAGRGHKLEFHGVFKSKRAAVRKERKTAGAFVHEEKIGGHRRYGVFTKKRG